MKTRILKGDISPAADIILGGGLLAVPTETVYGLCANGLDEAAVEKVYEAKNRPERKPVSLFVLNMKDAEKFCRDIPQAAYRLAEKFWPGPLTMILRRRDIVPDIITAGGGGVGVRCPDYAPLLDLMKMVSVPLTGTSANLSGMPDAVTFEEVFAYLDGRAECIYNGGKCPGGVPSTVVDMTGGAIKILRQGAIDAAEIEKTAGEQVIK